MIAPRKLQSFGDAVQAVALESSSARSTSNVVTNVGLTVEVFEFDRAELGTSLKALEEAVRANLSETPINATRINSDRATVLFIFGSKEI
jgi:hypothetical protein